MGWLKVHSDDLHKVATEVNDEVGMQRSPELVEVKTRDVKVYIARYHTDMYIGLGDKYISDELMTKTNARDAFLKAVHELMATRGFDPERRYSIGVQVKTVKEPV